ncbi:MAG TPA: aldehyde dehydrogenase family protein, partial [Verrucomicrobiae bacterium]|nr:aldehyde dehydrogenase family protein [Verrucomicrobiae bacterium]
LSGCDAVIIRADADLDLTAKALLFGLQLNCGATCLCPKRVFVAAEVATELESRLGDLIERANSSHRASRTNGRATTVSTPDTVWPLIEQALSLGAHLLPCGTGIETEHHWPMILAEVPVEAQILKEDVFWPVLSIVRVQDDMEAVQLAKDCPFALGASIFSRNEAAARGLAEQINVGVVTINDLIIPTADPRLPFGGRRHSGFGVTRGPEGLLELTRPKVITATRTKYRPAFEAVQPWHEQLFAAYLRLSHDRQFSGRAMGLFQMLKAVVTNRKTLMGKIT